MKLVRILNSLLLLILLGVGSSAHAEVLNNTGMPPAQKPLASLQVPVTTVASAEKIQKMVTAINYLNDKIKLLEGHNAVLKVQNESLKNQVQVVQGQVIQMQTNQDGLRNLVEGQQQKLDFLDKFFKANTINTTTPSQYINR
jgi:hypothetical protein